MAKHLRAKPEGLLFDDLAPDAGASAPKLSVDALGQPVSTRNKASLVERYLYHFVLITKHGTYIDGFAGPQKRDEPNTWAAKLVLESEPPWLRHLYLFERTAYKVRELEELKREQLSQASGREIEIYRGDFNQRVYELLESKRITDKEATFCLLDQHTFECYWSTVRTLAAYKTGQYKIELFYFLANAWLGRAVHNKKRREELDLWWGGDGWQRLRKMTPQNRADLLCERFRAELGYKWSFSYPIFEREKGRGVLMYYMIHATDHKDGPPIMSRAYNEAVSGVSRNQQLSLFSEVTNDKL